MIKKGFSLVELMIVAAGIAGVAVVGMQISKTQDKSSSKAKFDSDVLLTTNEINAILSDPAKCFTTLGGKSALSTMTGINSINNNKYYSIAGGSAPANGYGNSNLQIQSYKLTATNAEVTANNSFLVIDYQNKQILKGTSGPNVLSKKVNLYVQVDGSNNITNCRSLSSSTADVWSRGSGSNIYYAGGRVGIGATSPVTTLQVAGAIMPGDQTQATVCTATTEGALRYNKISHQMEYCGASGSPLVYGFTNFGQTLLPIITSWGGTIFYSGPNSFSIATATCPAGYKAIGGGGGTAGCMGSIAQASLTDTSYTVWGLPSTTCTVVGSSAYANVRCMKY